LGIITSKSNKTVQLVRALQTQQKTRHRERLFVLEGVRLAEEALESGGGIRWVLHAGRLGPRERSIINRLARSGAAVEEVDPDILRACSDTVSPQDVIVVMEQPALSAPDPLEWALVVDGVTNPGTLGTVLRSAEAFGVQAAFFAPGCVDAFNPKVVRGAMGAHLRLPIFDAGWADIAKRLEGFNIFIAEAREGLPAADVDWSGRVALILGGEAAGAGGLARAMATGFVHIPMRGKTESLSAAVAGSILLYEAARSRGGIA
jgi:RNA methyltransferase, TrmH family